MPQEDAFSRFQQQLMTPQNLVIGYAGVWSHEQFRDHFERNLVQYGECKQMGDCSIA